MLHDITELKKKVVWYEQAGVLSRVLQDDPQPVSSKDKELESKTSTHLRALQKVLLRDVSKDIMVLKVQPNREQACHLSQNNHLKERSIF